MSARHVNIDAVKKELAAMREVGVIDERRYAAALRYVATNEEEVSDMCEYSPVSDVANSVVEIAGSCANGRCE